MTRITFLTIAALVAATFTTATAAAQGRDRAPQERVRVALVEALPIRTAGAMIVRQDGRAPLIVLDRKHAEPVMLGMALALAEKLGRTPVGAGEQQIVPIQGGVARTAPSAARLAYLQAQLRALEARPAGRIGSLGTGRFIEIVKERAPSHVFRS